VISNHENIFFLQCDILSHFKKSVSYWYFNVANVTTKLQLKHSESYTIMISKKRNDQPINPLRAHFCLVLDITRELYAMSHHRLRPFTHEQKSMCKVEQKKDRSEWCVTGADIR